VTPEELRLRTERDRRIALQGLNRLLEAVGASAMRGAFGKHADEEAPQAAPAMMTGVPEATTENIRAERERRRSAKEPSGYDALAAHFCVDASTVRRRLGKLK